MDADAHERDVIILKRASFTLLRDKPRENGMVSERAEERPERVIPALSSLDHPLGEGIGGCEKRIADGQRALLEEHLIRHLAQPVRLRADAFGGQAEVR